MPSQWPARRPESSWHHAPLTASGTLQSLVPDLLPLISVAMSKTLSQNHDFHCRLIQFHGILQVGQYFHFRRNTGLDHHHPKSLHKNAPLTNHCISSTASFNTRRVPVYDLDQRYQDSPTFTYDLREKLCSFNFQVY